MEKLITDFSLGLFFWQTLLFVVLVVFLKKYAWKPILLAVDKREEGIKQALSSAEKAREEMKNLNADNERILKQAKIERDSLLKEARETKEKIINESRIKATEEAERIMATSREQIANEKARAIVELKNTVASLSVDFAEKLLKRELNDKINQEKFIEAKLKETELN